MPRDGDWRERRPARYMSFMPKRPKVVSIATTPEPKNSDRNRVIARDAVTNRVVFAIGPRRFAFEFTTRELPPGTGDHPASVVPFPRQEKPSGTTK